MEILFNFLSLVNIYEQIEEAQAAAAARRLFHPRPRCGEDGGTGRHHVPISERARDDQVRGRGESEFGRYNQNDPK